MINGYLVLDGFEHKWMRWDISVGGFRLSFFFFAFFLSLSTNSTQKKREENQRRYPEKWSLKIIFELWKFFLFFFQKYHR